ncbi:type I restriction endonuclease subunit S [Burkholderia cepacia JBK9]|nr:type I restriction endonuclease subunit S [Burkholderia cepacia JBK9]
MDAQRFLAEFGHIASAPGGITQLRELVLHLAVSGRLTDQLNGEDAPSFLAEINSRRKNLSDEGEIRANRKIRSEEIAGPWAIPNNWQWCRFGQLCSFSAGRTPSRKEQKYWNTGDYPWFSIADLQHGRVVSTSRETVSESAREEIFKSDPTPAGSLLMSFKLTIGKLCLLGVDAYHNEAIVTIEPFSDILKDYFFKCLNGFDLSAGNKAAIKGNTLNQDSISNILIALPPKAEIQRIVAKVDELMTLCDKLEAQQKARRKLQNALRQSTLQAVAVAASPHELQTTWACLANNFDRLFYAPEDVADLRRMVSELAIRGAFDAFSEPTDTATVDAYLAELASKKSSKRFAKSIQVEEEISLPNGWRWVLLEDLLADSESGWSPKCDAEPRRNGEWGVLKVSAVTWGIFNPDENKRLPPSLESRPECEVKPGDFMLSRANTAELVARSVIAPDDCPAKLLMSDKIVRLKFLDEALKPWVNLVNNSDFSRAYYKERATGTSDSMRNVSRQVIHELPIPLPSLKVQERVLHTLDGLMRLCDDLERKAADRMGLSAQLLTTTVSSITGIASEQEENPMKAPQTELIAMLRSGNPPSIKAQAPLATILARHNGEMPAKDLWQRFGGEIGAFYAQLKTEVAHGWVLEPVVAEMRERPVDMADA